MTRLAWIVASALLLAGSGCARDPTASRSAVATPPAAVEAATEGALCAEHGVLQVVCTKCNPALVAVFEAKGDWCAEHGFAESFCPICHPERGGKPQADVSSDGAPADGTKVRFRTRDTARLAGIETATAAEAAPEAGISAVARIVYDATKVALVSARARGLVEAIRADVGTKVRRGSALAVIRSATVGAERSQLTTARSREALARSDLERIRGLVSSGSVSPREVQEREQTLAAAQSDLASLEASLAVVGDGAGDTYTLTAPIAGVVTRRDATVAMAVDGGAALFEIVDNATMWAEIDVPDTELGQVTVGLGVVLTFDGLDREFRGEIDYIAPSIDPSTRTAMARVALKNPDGALRANMFGAARIAVAGTEAVTVPRAAVQRAKGVDLVFVRLAEDEFEARRVDVRRRDGDTARIGNGIRAGEIVVTEGSFLLKTETLKESIGAGCCAGE